MLITCKSVLLHYFSMGVNHQRIGQEKNAPIVKIKELSSPNSWPLIRPLLSHSTKFHTYIFFILGELELFSFILCKATSSVNSAAIECILLTGRNGTDARQVRTFAPLWCCRPKIATTRPESDGSHY